MLWAEAEEPVSLAKHLTLWTSFCNKLSSVLTPAVVVMAVPNVSASVFSSDLRYNESCMQGRKYCHFKDRSRHYSEVVP